MSRGLRAASGAFAFILTRTLVNATARRLKRLREPRYLLGFVVGLLYLYFYWFRLMFAGRAGKSGGPWAGGGVLPAELLSLVLVAASFVLAVVAALAWMLFTSPPTLALSEAEVQVLLPAPLPPRAVVHFALLRSQLGIAFSSLVAGLVFLRAFSAHGAQRVGGTWIVLSMIQLHLLGLSFSKGAWREGPRTRGRVIQIAAGLLAGLLILALAGSVLDLMHRVGNFRSSGALSLATITTAVAPWREGWVPRVLLAPFRAALGPLFSPDLGTFLRALPAALSLLVLHYFWVVRVTGRYEEAAVEGARQRAERAARFRKGKVTRVPGEPDRHVVPFRLGSAGAPGWAIVWKNLLSRRRASLTRVISRLALLWILLFVTAVALASAKSLVFVLPVVMSAGFMAVALALALPLGLRNDFRGDLEHASILRAWPLGPSRIVAAELLAPLFVCVLWLWGLLGALVAILAGTQASLAWRGAAPSLGQVPAIESQTWTVGVPALVALALFLPGLSAAVLVVQNAAVLAFPAWFPPGPRRVRGVEATGTRLIGLLGTLLILVFALVPAALLAGLVAWGAWGFVGAWALPPAGLAAALPVWAEVGLAVPLLARLFASFDVSAEAVE